MCLRYLAQPCEHLLLDPSDCSPHWRGWRRSVRLLSEIDAGFLTATSSGRSVDHIAAVQKRPAVRVAREGTDVLYHGPPLTGPPGIPQQNTGLSQGKDDSKQVYSLWGSC